jgi:hypothetical protein
MLPMQGTFLEDLSFSMTFEQNLFAFITAARSTRLMTVTATNTCSRTALCNGECFANGLSPFAVHQWSPRRHLLIALRRLHRRRASFRAKQAVSILWVDGHEGQIIFVAGTHGWCGTAKRIGM